MHTLTLTKHHGWGNDFLVFIDLDERHPLDEDLARSLCDRHRGIGADSIIRVGPGTELTHFSMDFRNANGSVAEMSGNGIRCMAQAVFDAGHVTTENFTVMTGAGVRGIRVNSSREGIANITVDMGLGKVVHEGRVKVGSVSAPATSVDMGNPHLVVSVPDPGAVDLEMVGPLLEASIEGGVNVEFVDYGASPPRMRVWERGVGETEACGTGVCAVAIAGKNWGFVGDDVVVRQTGGDAEIQLTDLAVLLTGPAQYICKIEVPCL